MLLRVVGIIVTIFAVAALPPGFEVGAIIRKIDAEKRIAEVYANGQERTVRM